MDSGSRKSAGRDQKIDQTVAQEAEEEEAEEEEAEEEEDSSSISSSAAVTPTTATTSVPTPRHPILRGAVVAHGRRRHRGQHPNGGCFFQRAEQPAAVVV